MNRDQTQYCESWIGRYRRALFTLVLVSGFIPWQCEGGMPTDVDGTEARYLKKMLSFVEWPSAPESPMDNFRVCVAEDYRITFPLSEELRGITISGRKINVQMISTTESPRNCRVLFIGSPEPKLRAKLLESVKGTQVLTVGDDAGFLEAGGILEFVQTENRIQFAVNLHAAKRAGLKIDSRLLALAQRVLPDKEVAGT